MPHFVLSDFLQSLLRASDFLQSLLRTITPPSKFTTWRAKINDVEIFKASLRDLGISFKTDAYVCDESGQRVRVDLVVVLGGEYDLGWYRKSDGSCYLIADLWSIAQKPNAWNCLMQLTKSKQLTI